MGATLIGLTEVWRKGQSKLKQKSLDCNGR